MEVYDIAKNSKLTKKKKTKIHYYRNNIRKRDYFTNVGYRQHFFTYKWPIQQQQHVQICSAFKNSFYCNQTTFFTTQK